jgi:HEAT repeat protein
MPDPAGTPTAPNRVAQLCDPSWKVRRAAVRDLAGCPGDAVPYLLAALEDSDAAVREAAAEALAACPDATPDALLALATRLRDRDEAVRAAAADALGRPDADPQALAAALGDRAEAVRAAAAQALGRLGPADVRSTAGLLAALRDASPPVRRAAARALGQAQCPSVVSALLDACDRHADMEDDVLDALVSLGRRLREVGPVLLGAFDERGHGRQRLAGKALARLGSPAAVETLRGWLADRRPGRKRRALRLLPPFAAGAPGLLAGVTAALDDGHAHVRLAAVVALRAFAATALPAVPHLIRRRFDGDRQVRRAAAATFAHLLPCLQSVSAHAGRLRPLGGGRARPGVLLRELLWAPHVPDSVRAELLSACRRRQIWHAGHCRAPVVAPPGSAGEPVWQAARAAAWAAGRAALGKDASADEDRLHQHARTAEHAWQLAFWWGLLHGAAPGGRIQPPHAP